MTQVFRIRKRHIPLLEGSGTNIWTKPASRHQINGPTSKQRFQGKGQLHKMAKRHLSRLELNQHVNIALLIFLLPQIGTKIYLES